jgi:TolB-like protein
VVDLLERLRTALTDRYIIQREVGRGGMACVFLGHDDKHGRPVAIKVLKPELAAALGNERFLREISIAAQLNHPHILPLYDSGEADGLLYYVMPFVEGESVRDRLRREKQLPVEDAVAITRDVADALAYAHSRGVVHRDIKPENILLESGHAMVTDFGIARAVSAAGGAALTETGVAVGTPAYMSPEQAVGTGEVDSRSDVYSLGCVLYEMLAGAPPFIGPTVQAIFARRMTDAVPSLQGVRERIPEAVERTVHKALARSPADRFSTAVQFAGALSVAAGDVAPAGRRFRGRPLVLTSAAILVVAAAIGLVRTIARPGPPASATRIAVLPFAVHGSGSFGYLGDGIVDLLSRNLDGAEQLRSVDAGTIFTTVGHGAGGPLDAARARAIATRVGAGLYVMGSVHALGSQLRIQAQVYDQAAQADDSAPGAHVTVEGDSAQLFELVDRLSVQLMVARRSGPVSRLRETAAHTTRSVAALKAYLTAEATVRAGGDDAAQLDSAIAGFQHAVAQDSTFALAYYRLAVTAGWRGRHALASTAHRRALALSDRLSERDRALLTAYAGYHRGAADEAERRYRAILRDYPDDLEAEFQLADLLFHYNPLRGRPQTEAREPFDRVLALDPGFL